MNHGNLVTITAQQVLVMFLLILVGYLAVRVKVLGAEARQNFSSLLINIVVPAMIVDSYLIPFDPAILSNLLRTALASAAVLFAGLGIALLATRRMKDPNRPLLRFAITFSNAAYMGFPLIEALFGAEGLLYASIFNTFFNILIWTAAPPCWPPAARKSILSGSCSKAGPARGGSGADPVPGSGARAGPDLHAPQPAGRDEHAPSRCSLPASSSPPATCARSSAVAPSGTPFFCGWP